MDRPPSSTHRIERGTDGEPVLVKGAQDEVGRARLRTEATVLRALDHPGTARVVALHDTADGVELHLAWAGSHTLATVRGLGPRPAAHLVAAVATTVADVHRTGLVHRRISPDHVLLGAGAQPILTGFAEALRADRAHPAEDVAALGALLAGMLGVGADGLDLPERRRDGWNGNRWGGLGRSGERDLRGALLTLADQARADDPAARPSAAELASSLRALAGHPPGPSGPDRPAGPAIATSPGSRRRRGPGRIQPGRWLRGATVVLLAILGIGAGVGALGARGDGSAGSTASRPVPSTTRPTTASADTTTATADPRPSAPLPPASPDGTESVGCPPVAGRTAHDIDGNGCPEEVHLDGERVTVGTTTWVVGRAGDQPAVGDWDCDGTATVAVLRPATGEVFLYDRWVDAGGQLTVRSATRVEGAEQIRGIDPDGDGCTQLTVTGPNGAEIPIDLGVPR